MVGTALEAKTRWLVVSLEGVKGAGQVTGSSNSVNVHRDSDSRN